ncbi:MAG: GNAT family N-acetyltransferase [Deltaproteobacteria bacterium]|nr:GNAT family N-acetyltransferase [Deltaproteobacteria bacterium]
MNLALPDLPRWVEAHDLARDPDSWHREGCIGHDGGAAPLICVYGTLPVDAVVALANAHPKHTLLVPREREDLVLALPRPIARAILHTLPDPDALPDCEGAAPLPEDASLAHLPDDLRAELEDARARTTVWTAWVDGIPASFAYASAQSAAWFDIGVDTVAGARQLGLATIVASTMIRAERTNGREPVWGATEDNQGSLRLAARLGFVAVDELWVAAPAVH